jgi:hypothetical protein
MPSNQAWLTWSKNMKNAICGNWHFWESNGQILASNEVLKKLYSFNTFDNACNWLSVHNLGIAKQFYKAWKA